MSAETANFFNLTRGVRKILVVDLGFLGDTLHLLPALHEIRRNYSNAQVHVLTTPIGVQVLDLAPWIDRAWPLELDPVKRSGSEHWRAISALRREHFDVAFNFSGADRTIFLTALSGARWRVAHAAGRKHFWNQWLIPIWISRRDPLLPAFEQRRQVLAACGLTLEKPAWGLIIPDDHRQRAAALVASPAIHFSINASSFLKEWPLEHWIVLARQLLDGDASLRIIATGSASEREQQRLKALAAGVGDERLKLQAPGLPIADLAAVLSRCRLHIGGDSGVLHLAVALGVPTVALFRDYHDAKSWMPSGPTHRTLTVPCACVNRPDPPCATVGRAQCLAELSPAVVAQAVEQQLRTQSSNAV